MITFSPCDGETIQASWGREENEAPLSRPRSDGRLFLKSEEGKSTCRLDGSYKLERKLRHCKRLEKRSQRIYKLGSRLFPPNKPNCNRDQPPHASETIKTQWEWGGAAHADREPALRTPINAQETIPSVQPKRAPGIRRWQGLEIMQPIPSRLQ